MCSVRRHKNTDADGFILRFSSIFVCPLNVHAAERIGRSTGPEVRHLSLR